ncbi:MAG: hypothetical protein DRN68_06695, partial [Thaumarchaeota archaeon]
MQLSKERHHRFIFLTVQVREIQSVKGNIIAPKLHAANRKCPVVSAVHESITALHFFEHFPHRHSNNRAFIFTYILKCAPREEPPGVLRQ